MWRQKSPKPKIVNFILRNNRTYKILFRKNELFVDGKLTWTEEHFNNCYLIKFVGMGPQDFRQRIKKKGTRDKRKILK